jgi:hypothetical protein
MNIIKKKNIRNDLKFFKAIWGALNFLIGVRYKGLCAELAGSKK